MLSEDMRDILSKLDNSIKSSMERLDLVLQLLENHPDLLSKFICNEEYSFDDHIEEFFTQLNSYVELK